MLKVKKEIIMNKKTPIHKQYKKAVGGVFGISCKKTKKIYISSSINMELQEHKLYIQLKNGLARNKELQDDFNKFGINHFKTKVLNKITYSELIRLTENELYAYLDKELDHWLNFYKKYLYNKRKTSFRTVCKKIVDIREVKKRKILRKATNKGKNKKVIKKK